MEIVERICTHVGIIANGTLVEQTSLASLRTGTSLEQRFLEKVGRPDAEAQHLSWLDEAQASTKDSVSPGGTHDQLDTPESDPLVEMAFECESMEEIWWNKPGHHLNRCLLASHLCRFLILRGDRSRHHLLPRFEPIQLMYLWDVVVGILVFSWTISLLTEVQRMEMLSLDKLLHLPLSLRDAFLLNYASSCFSLNVICFVPLCHGNELRSRVHAWRTNVVLVPMTMAFLLM